MLCCYAAIWDNLKNKKLVQICFVGARLSKVLVAEVILHYFTSMSNFNISLYYAKTLKRFLNFKLFCNTEVNYARIYCLNSCVHPDQQWKSNPRVTDSKRHRLTLPIYLLFNRMWIIFYLYALFKVFSFIISSFSSVDLQFCF